MVRTLLLLVLSGLPLLGLAQSASIPLPIERQSFVQGTQIPAKITVTTAGLIVSQVEMYTNTGGTSASVLVGTSTTAPYLISFTTPATGFIQLYAKVTFTNGATVVSSNRIITGISPTACNTGANVKSFYVQAGAGAGSSGGTNTLGASQASPIGSFQNIIKGGVTIGGTSSLRPLPGDIIYIVANGSAPYSLADDQTNLISMIRTGTPGCPITIRNIPGERPKLKMTGSNPNALFIPSGVSYVNITGLEIEGLYTSDVSVNLTAATNQARSCATPAGTPPNSFNGNGITIDGKDGGAAHPHHISITDNLVHNCSGAGIGAVEADYITIDNNTVYNNSWYTVYSTSGINIFHPWNLPDGQSPAYRNYIRNNKSYGNRNYVPWNSGCKITDGNGIILDDFQNTQSTSSIQNQVYTGQTLVANNVVFNNGGSGVHAFKGVKADIVNNTAYLNSQTQGTNTPIGEIYAQQSNDIQIVNNIIRPITGENTFTTNTGNTNVAYTNNLYLVDATTQVPTTSGNILPASSTETSVFVLPATDPATANFQLKLGSAALNEGSNAFATIVSTDFRGTARPQGTGIDIGAYEPTLQELPVRLSSFSAKPLGDQVAVAWTTASEQNSAFFEVERSADAREFGPIGRIDAAGESQTSQNYGLLDVKPLAGTSYYRLKQVDQDDTFAYSKIVSVVLDGVQPSFELLGNPTESHTIRVVTRNLAGAVFELTTLAGQPIGVMVDALVDGGRVLSPVQPLAAGLYLLRAQLDSQQLTRKILVR